MYPILFEYKLLFKEEKNVTTIHNVFFLSTIETFIRNHFQNCRKTGKKYIKQYKQQFENL